MEARKAVAEKLGWEIEADALVSILSEVRAAHPFEIQAFGLCVSLQERVEELEKALTELAKGNRAPGVLRIARAALAQKVKP